MSDSVLFERRGPEDGRDGFLYAPEECPGHEFGCNDGQPVDDHCRWCGIAWAPWFCCD